MSKNEEKMGFIVIKFFLLLFFLMAFAKSKVHGISSPGSYSDMTVSISLYQFIFGMDDIYGHINFNLLMFIGLTAYICHLIISVLCFSQPSKSLHKMNIISLLVSIVGLSPIGIYMGIDTYNSTAYSGYDHTISMTMKPWILLIALIVFLVLAYDEYLKYTED